MVRGLSTCTGMGIQLYYKQDTVESGLAIDSTNSAKSNSVQSEHILQRES